MRKYLDGSGAAIGVGNPGWYIETVLERIHVPVVGIVGQVDSDIVEVKMVSKGRTFASNLSNLLTLGNLLADRDRHGHHVAILQFETVILRYDAHEVITVTKNWPGNRHYTAGCGIHRSTVGLRDVQPGVEF